MEPTAGLIIVSGKDIVGEAGGASTYARAMGLAAVQAGFTPEVFCIGRKDEILDTPFGRIHTVASPLRWLIRHAPGGGFRTRFMPFHARPVRRRIESLLGERSGPFIVHGLGPWGGVAVDVKKRMATDERPIIPIVTIWSTMEHEHRGKVLGVSPRHGLAAWLRARFEYWWMTAMVMSHDRAGITGVDRVIVNYESVASQIREVKGHAPIEIVPYAAEAAFEEPLSSRDEPEPLRQIEPREAPLVVAVSRHDSRKGLDILLEALAGLKDRKVPFRACLVGPGPLLNAHRRLAAKLGLGDSTAIVGHAPDPIAYLQHADIFVLPSTEEGSGSVSMLEAVQVGLAIVASDIDGIPEDVNHDDSAELVPAGNATILSQALERVILDDGLRNRLQRRSREVFEERFTATRFAESLRSLYRDLLPKEG